VLPELFCFHHYGFVLFEFIPDVFPFFCFKAMVAILTIGEPSTLPVENNKTKKRVEAQKVGLKNTGRSSSFEWSQTMLIATLPGFWTQLFMIE
jgi:hypothetical protein